MTTRDILDYQGNIIGQLELPEGTSEEVWAAKLAPYAVPPTTLSEIAQQALDLNIEQRRAYCEALMGRFKRVNIQAGITAAQGLWMHHRIRAFAVNYGDLSVTVDVLNMVVSGDVELGCIALQSGVPDDMSMPYHWLSADRIAWLVNDMKQFLGWP